ncbi:MAG: class B sortase [Bacillota bacterium]|nr:class B sortase [Bacillota bacterium]
MSEESISKKKKRRKIIIRSLRILFTIGFIVFSVLFINEVLIQPYKLKKAIDKARDLYHTLLPQVNVRSGPNIEVDNRINTPDDSKISVAITPTPDPNRDEKGRLIKFKKLLEVNEEVKGWIKIDNINGENDTKIDYVVVQSDPKDPEFYLTRDWTTKEYLKAGSIFLDSSSSVERNTKNLVIHGHNMTSSDDMFHYLLEYKKLDFMKEHPIISFDTIYEEALWKVFSVFITPGNDDKGDFFRYNRSTFKNHKDFLEFIYQLRVRSFYNIDDIDINEDDQILTLSTCSYELANYRIVVVARKIREGEEARVDIDSIKKNKKILYPESFYKHYGGKAPDIPSSFEEALQEGLISWYQPINR